MELADAFGAGRADIVSRAAGEGTSTRSRIWGWTAAGWRFVVPAEGMRLTLRSSGVEFDFHDGAWLSGPGVVGSATPAIADPLGGITTEVNMWASVAQILSALRGHGLIQT